VVQHERERETESESLKTYSVNMPNDSHTSFAMQSSSCSKDTVCILVSTTRVLVDAQLRGLDFVVVDVAVKANDHGTSVSTCFMMLYICCFPSPSLSYCGQWCFVVSCAALSFTVSHQLCGVVPCRPVLCRAVPCRAVPRRAILCHIIAGRIVLQPIMPHHCLHHTTYRSKTDHPTPR
jgi:hypothetical protein